MKKNDNIHILFKTLTDTLPYEYNEELIDNENTIVITKEGSDYAMAISPDELHADNFEVTVSHDDTTKGNYKEHELFYWTTEEEKIPISDIITDIKNRF
jgi:hypothetical protein